MEDTKRQRERGFFCFKISFFAFPAGRVVGLPIRVATSTLPVSLAFFFFQTKRENIRIQSLLFPASLSPFPWGKVVMVVVVVVHQEEKKEKQNVSKGVENKGRKKKIEKKKKKTRSIHFHIPVSNRACRRSIITQTLNTIIPIIPIIPSITVDIIYEPQYTSNSSLVNDLGLLERGQFIP